MGGTQSVGGLAPGESKNWQTRYTAYANREGGNFLLADGKPLILKATIELKLDTSYDATPNSVLLHVRETGKDKAHTTLVIALRTSRPVSLIDGCAALDLCRSLLSLRCVD